MKITASMIQDWLIGRGFPNAGLIASGEFLEKYKLRLEYAVYQEVERIADELQEEGED